MKIGRYEIVGLLCHWTKLPKGDFFHPHGLTFPRPALCLTFLQVRYGPHKVRGAELLAFGYRGALLLHVDRELGEEYAHLAKCAGYPNEAALDLALAQGHGVLLVEEVDGRPTLALKEGSFRPKPKPPAYHSEWERLRRQEGSV